MRYFLFFLILIISVKVSSQADSDEKKREFGTIEFSRKDNPLSLPIINLYEGEYVQIKFDIFGAEEETFMYSIELCDYNWEPVDISKMDYIDGFIENTFEYFAHSMNTTIGYVQYRLELPNSDMEITKGGNYLLKIFDEEYPEEPILTKKFIVVDEEVTIEITEDKFQSEILMDRQELNVSIQPDNVSFNDLVGNIKLCIIQNNDWNTIKNFEKYTTDGTGAIIFNSPGQIVFTGMNEFRMFDTKSLKFISERVQHIDYVAPYIHVYLKPDKLRGGRRYFYNEDLNGLFYIENQESLDDDQMDADYVMVHFVLETGVPLPADLYIEGALFDWKREDNYMDFNPEKGTYEKTFLLKQGLYNYRYSLLEYSTKRVDYEITEGNYQETANNYQAILYYRPLGDLYYYPAGSCSIITDQKY